MVFLTFLASLALLQWIVRKEPGLGKSNQSAHEAHSSIQNESALSTLDLASLARSLARECPKPAVPDKVLVRNKPSRDENANLV
jgi:hypothetical protein